MDLNSEANEETFRKIGARLAAIGDQLADEIEDSIVNNLAQQFMRENLSSQVRKRRNLEFNKIALEDFVRFFKGLFSFCQS